MVAIAALTLVASACAQPAHVHEEGTAEDGHAHDDAAAADDGHAHDDEEAGIDHHGNAIYDDSERVYEQLLAEGLSVEFSVENFLGVGGRGGEVAPRLVEGEHAVLQFNITESATGAQAAGLNPAVWLDVTESSERDCTGRVSGYLAGTLDSRPLIDLNSYFILGMNRDNTISVIDPLVDVGGMTNLFALIILQGRGQDWAPAGDPLKMFVTMPDLNKVAVANLEGFVVEENIDVGGRPGQIIAQPGGSRVWVAIEPILGGNGGVAIIDAASRALIGEIATGPGPQSIAFAPDGGTGYVADAATGTVTVIDTASLEVVTRIGVGANPVAVAVSALTGAVYVADGDAGTISVVDGSTHVETTRLLADPGLTGIEISPDGHWGVAVNPIAEKVYVIETANARITHAVPVKGSPDQIIFTDEAAYVRSGTTPAVFAIPLAEIDPTGDISVLTVPIGQAPPGSDVLADAVTPTPDGEALLIANPVDDTIYFYAQGSQASTGGFQGHTLAPQAVGVVDRSLKERSPGVYTGSIRIPTSGDFVVAFLLSDPQIVHCFSFTALPDPEGEAVLAALELEVLSELNNVQAGDGFQFEVALTDSEGRTVGGAEDLFALVNETNGNWNDRFFAVPRDDGTYAFDMTIPRSGTFQVFFAAASLGADYESFPIPTIHVND